MPAISTFSTMLANLSSAASAVISSSSGPGAPNPLAWVTGLNTASAICLCVLGALGCVAYVYTTL
ncbi:hypothetical protein PoHVEF18_007706 [Penicillium ochrochloron]